MPDSARTTEPDIRCSDDRCAGVRGCASDLPAHGVRVCGCVYTAHHTPVLTTTENPTRCADADSRTPTGDPEPIGAIAERVLTDLAARQAEVLNRLRRQKPAIRTKEQP